VTRVTEERLTPNRWPASSFSSFVPRLRLVCWEGSFHEVVRSHGSMLLQDAVMKVVAAGTYLRVMFAGTF
jgi:hypothetical protein